MKNGENGQNIKGRLLNNEKVEFTNTGFMSISGFRLAIETSSSDSFAVKSSDTERYVRKEEIDPDSLYRPELS